ncbi:MAG: hypothetical protein LBC74_09690 [Planctomycetaceae bacterium]|jgi:hypothetical protein|nr:hypothetical protein [Planctomycetaceae bacterium]
MKMFCFAGIFAMIILALVFTAIPASAQPLPDTKPIEWTENYFERNSRLITEFLDKKIAGSELLRAKYWNRDFASSDAYQQSVAKNRERLKFITGVRDNRVGFDTPELICTLVLTDSESLLKCLFDENWIQ